MEGHTLSHSGVSSGIVAASAAATAAASELRMGIFFNAKKRQQFLAPLFPEETYQTAHPDGESGAVTVRVIVIEHENDLARLGPFDVLLLKLTDMMTCARFSTDQTERRTACDSLEQIQQYISQSLARGVLAVVEPFVHVERVLNRAAIQAMVQQLHVHFEDDNGTSIKCAIPPAFLYQRALHGSSTGAVIAQSSSTAGSLPVISSLPANTRFPVICKTVAACGSATSHRMYILQQAKDFDLMHEHAEKFNVKPAASPSGPDSPYTSPHPVWLVQQYVNHGGVIYKVYVLDEEIQILAKPSLPDLGPNEHTPYWLNSQDMILRHLESVESASTRPVAPPVELIVPSAVVRAAHACVQQLRQCISLTLFGFDLIDVGSNNNIHHAGDSDFTRFFLVDINYFPSYKTVENLREKLLQICVKKHAEQVIAIAARAAVARNVRQ